MWLTENLLQRVLSTVQSTLAILTSVRPGKSFLDRSSQTGARFLQWPHLQYNTQWTLASWIWGTALINKQTCQPQWGIMCSPGISFHKIHSKRYKLQHMYIQGYYGNYQLICCSYDVDPRSLHAGKWKSFISSHSRKNVMYINIITCIRILQVLLRLSWPNKYKCGWTTQHHWIPLFSFEA